MSDAKLHFGTDGVRGVANTELTPEQLVALGRAAARVFAENGEANTWLIGRDTRRSGPLIQAALSSGLASEGADVVDLGVLPTPGVAFHAQRLNLPGAVISASHNPFIDNGVKLLAAGGRKLPDVIEAQIEQKMDEIVTGIHDANRKSGLEVGTLRRASHAYDNYIDHVTGVLGNSSALDGLKIVLDCANGAASIIAPTVFEKLGAQVHVLHATPDGSNINTQCGSTYPGDLQATVTTLGAHLGLAFDGDADRLIAVDHTGAIIDGDRVIGLCALDRLARGLLTDDTVVVTVMSNLGFRLAMERAGIKVFETKVGDRYVLEALEANNWSLGGEQSGHVVFRDIATTGDGILTGVILSDLTRRSGRTLHTIASEVMQSVPQVLLNVRVADRSGLEQADSVWSDVKSIEEHLKDSGRVLLRPSGTEPVVRVMVEAVDEAFAHAAADKLQQSLISALGAATDK